MSAAASAPGAAAAEALEVGLRAIGISCRVEAFERLAVLVPDGSLSAIEDARIRREAVALLRPNGFTHLALEITDGDGTS